MISIEEAEKILNGVTVNAELDEVPLMDSLGRILAEDIVSRINMPPFNKSAMDGYAYISGDDSAKLKVMEIIPAGTVPQHSLEIGQCSKIMTGGMVPPGSDRVVKVEVTEESDGYMTIVDEDPRINICYKGEDIKPGDVVLKSGSLIRPPEIGTLASMGCNNVKVYKKSLVSIVTTGDEVIEPGLPLAEGQIYNSNAYSISAQVLQTGAEVQRAGIVEDDIELINKKIDALFTESRMVLISGGVSMGDYDFVPGVLRDLGVDVHFHKVAIQPGKPTIFGTRGNTLIFGMPGNPVSTFIIFEKFVKPLLCKTMGYDYKPSVVKGVLSKDFTRKRTVRTLYIPVRYNDDGQVDPVDYHGSAHFNALTGANGLLEVPIGVGRISKGSTVYVRQI